ncbi:MAG: DUF1801 domain-containing protein [Pseudomonadota bacterium]
MTDQLPQDIENALAAHDGGVRDQLLSCRDLIFQVAACHENVGPITETLKWGQPSYLTEATKTGSTLRLADSGDGRPALFVHCATDLIEQFRAFYPHTFDYQGKRALILKTTIDPVEAELRHCIALARTYKARKKSNGETGVGHKNSLKTGTNTKE